MLTAGNSMPHVDLLDDTGETVNTADYLGHPLVLWFYPKDDTPG